MAYAILAIVGVLSLIPVPDIADIDVKGSDKLIHFLVYFLLSAFFTVLVRFNRSLILIAAGLISYGILLEYLQSLTGYRMMEGYDILANSAGVICGLLVRAGTIPLRFRQIESNYF